MRKSIITGEIRHRENMNSGIPKLWTAEIISRALTLLGTMYTARILGVTMYGWSDM